MTLPAPEGSRWCAICGVHRVRFAEHYACPLCWDDGYRPTTRPMTVPLPRTPLSAIERLYRGLP